MRKRIPMVYGALILTCVNLLLRFAGTSFQVYISNTLGASAVGLLQLILSVGGMAMTAGIAGIRTGTMYLTAEELGKNRNQNVPWIVSGCMVYCLCTSGTIALMLYGAAPYLAENWVGSWETLAPLRIYSCFIPISCLCGVMTGYFTAANRIGTLAVVEVVEQLIAMSLTMVLLGLHRGDSAKACSAVVFGSCIGHTLTLLCLLILYRNNRGKFGVRIPVTRRIWETAVPLALADDLKAGISALENLMVPKRLSLCAKISDPLAAFGMMTGMVFPVVMFPAAILFSLAELLIPELARCAAAGSKVRIRYLVRQNLRVCMLYGLICSGILLLSADDLCMALYPNVAIQRYMKWFAALIPMLYCDALVDAMVKGLGQQTYSVKYNIITNGLDVLILYWILPLYGMKGYFVSFLITHLINFLLSVRRLAIVSEVRISMRLPCRMVLSFLISLIGASAFTGWYRRIPGFLGLFFSVSYFSGVLGIGDLQWLRGALTQK